MQLLDLEQPESLRQNLGQDILCTSVWQEAPNPKAAQQLQASNLKEFKKSPNSAHVNVSTGRETLHTEKARGMSEKPGDLTSTENGEVA